MEWQCVNQHFEKIVLKLYQVHIWVFNLDNIPTDKSLFYALLSEDELDHANNFRFDSDKNRFICAKGILRYLLYLQTKIQPSLIKFRYGKYKKPELIEQQNENSLKFNVSHSDSIFCVGMTYNQDIGIDIEVVKPITELSELVRKYFSESECKQIERLSGNFKLEVFYKLWTSKEAIMKLTGKGLSLPLNKFEIFINPIGKINIVNPKADFQNHLEKMYLESFNIEKEIIGTLAMNAKVDEIFYFKVEEYDDLIKNLERMA